MNMPGNGHGLISTRFRRVLRIIEQVLACQSLLVVPFDGCGTGFCASIKWRKDLLYKRERRTFFLKHDVDRASQGGTGGDVVLEAGACQASSADAAEEHLAGHQHVRSLPESLRSDVLDPAHLLL